MIEYVKISTSKTIIQPAKMSKPSIENTIFTDSKAARAKPDFYKEIKVNVHAVLTSWQLSIFSYEWMEKNTSIKAIENLKETDQAKRQSIEAAMQNQTPLEKPVLGIGIQDNIEIGSGKAVLCTLAASGITEMPVHIPKSNEADFQDFII